MHQRFLHLRIKDGLFWDTRNWQGTGLAFMRGSWVLIIVSTFSGSCSREQLCIIISGWCIVVAWLNRSTELDLPFPFLHLRLCLLNRLDDRPWVISATGNYGIVFCSPHGMSWLSLDSDSSITQSKSDWPLKIDRFINIHLLCIFQGTVDMRWSANDYQRLEILESLWKEIVLNLFRKGEKRGGGGY